MRENKSRALMKGRNGIPANAWKGEKAGILDCPKCGIGHWTYKSIEEGEEA